MPKRKGGPPAHPEWSNQDIEKALRKAGARFGSWAKDDLIHALPRSAFKLLLGNIQPTSTEFITRHERPKEAGVARAVLEWDVTLAAGAHGGKRLKYVASFEPFQGKLISLSELP